MQKVEETKLPCDGVDLYRERLPDGCFRLLQWEGTTQRGDEPLCFHLEIVPFDRDVSYDALSYRWSDPDPDRPEMEVVCDGVQVQVGSNLHAALLQISTLSDRSMYLWVDCLCIDQVNQEEKERQMLMMPKIYQSARRAIIWLGPGTDESSLAINSLLMLITLMTDVDESLRPGSNKQLTPDEAVIYRHVVNNAYFTPVPIFGAIWRLLCLDWGSRVWTLQEAALASDESIAMCGSKTFPYSRLAHFADRYVNDRAGHWVRLVAAIRSPTGGEDPNNPKLRFMVHPKAVLKMRKALEYNANPSAMKRPVVRLLDYIRVLSCTESRDRIFSIAAFLPSELVAAIRQSALLSTEALYTLFATIELQTYQNIQCISAAGLSQQRHTYREKHDTATYNSVLKLPSWVPDWTRKKTHESLWVLNEDVFESRGCYLYKATGDQKPSIAVHTSSTNMPIADIKGTILDEIIDHGEPYYVPHLPAFTDGNEHPEIVREFYNEITRQLDQYVSLGIKHLGTSNMPDQPGNLTLIRKTLIGGMVPEFGSSSHAGMYIKAKPEQIDPLFEYLKVMQNEQPEIYQESTPGTADPEHVFASTNRINPILPIGTMCKGRTFFVTRGNRVGMGPSILAKGDIICFFYGAPTPFVIRPFTKAIDPEKIERGEDIDDCGSSLYQLIGECYLEGLMDGEVMDIPGLAPESIRLV